MNKLSLSKPLLAFTFSVLSFSTFAAQVVMERNGITLTDEEIAQISSDLSESELADMKENPAMFVSFIEQVFDNKVMASALKDELAKDKSFDAISRTAMNQFSNEYYIKQQALEKIKAVKDYKTLAKQTYQADSVSYQLPETKDFYHILLVKQSDVDNQAKAQAILQKITDKQTTLAEAAKKYYTAIAGTNEQGVLEKVQVKQLMQPLQQAVMSMSIGDISEVIETIAGYHIIGLKQVNASQTRPYDPKIEKRIIKEIKEKIYRTTNQEIRDRYRGAEGLVVDETVLESITKKVLGH